MLLEITLIGLRIIYLIFSNLPWGVLKKGLINF
jgi:hypothetical protein